MRIWSVAVFFIGLSVGWFAHVYWDRGRLTFPVVYVDRYLKSPEMQSELSDTHFGTDELPLNTLQRLLKANQFQAAMELYEQAAQQGAGDLVKYQQAILTYARVLVQAKAYRLVDQLLIQYSTLAYQDIKPLLLLAKNDQQLKKYRQAIDHLYAAKLLTLESSVLQDIDRRLQEIIRLQTRIFKQDKDHAAIVAWYENLITQDPYQMKYYFRLAQGLMAIGEYQRAHETLLLINDAGLETKVQRLLHKLEVAIQFGGDNTIAIPLRSVGEHYLVDVQLNDELFVTLMIDTGASLSVVKRSLLLQLDSVNFDEARYQRINTANGPFLGQIISLNHLQIANLPVYDIEVAVIEDQQMHHFDGLLGMNYLKHFEFFIDQTAATLHLSLNVNVFEFDDE